MWFLGHFSHTSFFVLSGTPIKWILEIFPCLLTFLSFFPFLCYFVLCSGRFLWLHPQLVDLLSSCTHSLLNPSLEFGFCFCFCFLHLNYLGFHFHKICFLFYGFRILNELRIILKVGFLHCICLFFVIVFFFIVICQLAWSFFALVSLKLLIILLLSENFVFKYPCPSEYGFQLCLS